MFPFLAPSRNSVFPSFFSRVHVAVEHKIDFGSLYHGFILVAAFQLVGRSRATRTVSIRSRSGANVAVVCVCVCVCVCSRVFYASITTPSCNLFVILMKHESGKRTCWRLPMANRVPGFRLFRSVIRSRELLAEINDGPSVKCSW